MSQYGHGVGTATTDYYFTSDQVATFTAVPETNPILIWTCIAAVGATSALATARRKRRRVLLS